MLLINDGGLTQVAFDGLDLKIDGYPGVHLFVTYILNSGLVNNHWTNCFGQIGRSTFWPKKQISHTLEENYIKTC